jgi:hypothetical protein
VLPLLLADSAEAGRGPQFAQPVQGETLARRVRFRAPLSEAGRIFLASANHDPESRCRSPGRRPGCTCCPGWPLPRRVALPRVTRSAKSQKRQNPLKPTRAQPADPYPAGPTEHRAGCNRPYVPIGLLGWLGLRSGLVAHLQRSRGPTCSGPEVPPAAVQRSHLQRYLRVVPRRSGFRVDGVSHSLPFSDLLALTSSDMFLSVNVLIITVRMRSWLR